MSVANQFWVKFFRRESRRACKKHAAAKVPNLGVRLDRNTVKAHAYLAAHGLPHSPMAASLAVFLPVGR